jgi:transglutaminase-like putative cysteine protease
VSPRPFAPWSGSARPALPLALILLAAPALGAAERVTLAPPPPWVVEAALPDDGALPLDQIESGLFDLLRDTQTHGGLGATYTRVARKIVNTSGVQNGSELKLGFDPIYERLVFHHVRVLRAGRPVGRFDPAEVKVVHEETNLDERLYNSSLSALVFLRDVRPGDVVDYAWSVTGVNPILGDHRSEWLTLGLEVPVRRLRQRLVWPSARPLFLRPHATDLKPQVEAAGADRAYTWERVDAPAVRTENGAPSWFDPYPYVVANDFADWGAVARWATGVFAAQDRGSPELRALAKQWKAESRDASEAARRAVRFAQDDVRYLGLEMGPHSHRPHQPGEVLAQRFGDCKDKAWLLVSFLREMGLDAAPALVNTDARRGLDDAAPSPFAFDHAIVELRLPAGTVWVDATHAHQGGRLEDAVPPGYERALVLRPETAALAVIPKGPLARPELLVEEVYTLRDGGAARLEVTSTYRGRQADELRAGLSESSRTSIADGYLAHYQAEDDDVKAVGPPRFEDDREENVIVARESYDLPTFWKTGWRTFYAWVLDERLSSPGKRARTAPLAVAHPVNVAHTIRLVAGTAIDRPAERLAVEGEAFVARKEARVAGSTLTLDYSYRSRADALAPDKVRAHAAEVEKAQAALSYRLSSSALRSRFGAGNGGEGDDPAALWVGLTLIVLVAAAVVWSAGTSWRQRRRRQAYTRLIAVTEGEGPSFPRVAGDRASAEADALARNCRCGESLAGAAVEWQALSYGGARLSLATLRCPECGREQHVYYRLDERIA